VSRFQIELRRCVATRLYARKISEASTFWKLANARNQRAEQTCKCCLERKTGSKLVGQSAQSVFFNELLLESSAGAFGADQPSLGDAWVPRTKHPGWLPPLTLTSLATAYRCSSLRSLRRAGIEFRLFLQFPSVSRLSTVRPGSEISKTLVFLLIIFNI
jgi:hypothetical protein